MGKHDQGKADNEPGRLRSEETGIFVDGVSVGEKTLSAISLETGAAAIPASATEVGDDTLPSRTEFEAARETSREETGSEPLEEGGRLERRELISSVPSPDTKGRSAKSTKAICRSTRARDERMRRISSRTSKTGAEEPIKQRRLCLTQCEQRMEIVERMQSHACRRQEEQAGKEEVAEAVASIRLARALARVRTTE
jgi:hypothetical protein